MKLTLPFGKCLSAFLFLSLTAANADVTQYYAAMWEGRAWNSYHGLTASDYQSRFSFEVLQGYRLIDVSGYGIGSTDYYVGIWEQNDGRGWQAFHGLNASDYQTKFNTLNSQGWRPVHVAGYGVNGVALYAGIWEEGDGKPWAAVHGLNGTDYQTAFNNWTGQGYRPIDVSGYSVNGAAYYAGIWEKRDGPAWIAHHGLTAADYQTKFDLYASQGYRLIRISGFSINGADYYSGIWQVNDGRAWVARHGMSAADYQTYFDQYAGQGYRLVHVSGYEISGAPYFAAIWDKSSGVTDWAAIDGMSSNVYAATFSQYVNQGYRLLDVKGYEVNGQDRYAAIWEQRGGPPSITYHGLNETDYRNVFLQLANQGYRLVHVSGYGVNGVPRYAGIWEQNDGRNWIGEHRLSAEQFQNLFDQHKNEGYRLADIDAYTVNDVPYFAGVWDNASGPAFSASHVMTEKEYLNFFNQNVGSGYRLSRLSPYSVSGYPMYASLWEKSDGRSWVSEHRLTDSDYRTLFSQHVTDGFRARTVSGFSVDTTVPAVPASGVPVPELTAFDDAMKRFVTKRNIPAAVICVMRNGKIVLERAYGYQDQAQTIPLRTSALFRIASVTKPITEAGLRLLVSRGQLNLSSHAFDLGQAGGGILHITPFGTPDTRLKDITVQQLMDHQGGWDRDASGDPMFESIMIANALGVASPPSQTDTVRYMMGRPLDFAPGSKTVYSNFGYLLLGLIIEQITGTDYTAWIQQQILNPQGAASTEIQLGHSLPAQRNAREPWYSDANTDPNVFNPSITVSSPDGGFYLEAMEAHGGLISTARACAQFLRGYWINGYPRDNSTQEWWFFGSLPGTYALAHQRPDNVNIVVLMNQRADDDSYSIIKGITDSATDSITTWPSFNLEQLVAARPRINMDIHGGKILTPTENGRMYQLQGTADLVHWVNLGNPVVGDGSQLNLSFPTGAQRLFFRMTVE